MRKQHYTHIQMNELKQKLILIRKKVGRKYSISSSSSSSSRKQEENLKVTRWIGKWMVGPKKN